MFRALLILLSLFIPHAAIAQTATPEYPNPNLQDIAVVYPYAYSPTGAVIIYNPYICQQIGLACLFFKAHEHGHVYLGHQFQPGMHATARERDADQFAASVASPQAVYAAWRLFINGGSSSNWHTYGTPKQRARRLCLFAIQAGNWMGPTPCP